MKSSMHKDNIFISHDALVLMASKQTVTWMIENNYFHCWLLPINGLQDGTTYPGCTVGCIPEFMPLDNSLNRDTPHSLQFHCVLNRFVVDGGGTNDQERNMCFSFSTPKEITRGIKRIWEY